MLLLRGCQRHWGFAVGRGGSTKMKFPGLHTHATTLLAEGMCHSLPELRRGGGYKHKLCSHAELGPRPTTVGHSLAMRQDQVSYLSKPQLPSLYNEGDNIASWGY